MPTRAVLQAHDFIAHRLSQRTRADRPNTGGELMELARDIPDVVLLGRGDPDLPTPPHVVEAAVSALRAGHTHYTPRRGLTNYAMQLPPSSGPRTA